VPGGLVGIDPGVLQHISSRTEPLRAVTAILRAQTGFHVHEIVELHAATEEPTPHPSRGSDYIKYVMKTLAPKVEVICVQPRGAPAMTLSWRERRIVTTESTDTIADGVAGRIPIPSVLDDLLAVADDAVLVEEPSIITAMRMLFDHAGLVVEPSAALGIAAILEAPGRFAGRHLTTIVCGSNVDMQAYRGWIDDRT
jgi:hypothetical protein